jgi:hypothetical protein
LTRSSFASSKETARRRCLERYAAMSLRRESENLKGPNLGPSSEGFSCLRGRFGIRTFPRPISRRMVRSKYHFKKIRPLFALFLTRAPSKSSTGQTAYYGKRLALSQALLPLQREHRPDQNARPQKVRPEFRQTTERPLPPLRRIRFTKSAGFIGSFGIRGGWI